jgi:choline monooxygenase
MTDGWHDAGPVELVAEPGQYFTCVAGEIPVVVTRDRTGSLNAFVNVCRHRGHIVVDGAGKRETLQCPYHAWTYDLAGRLRAAPRSEREPEFDFSQLSLLPVQVELRDARVFVKLG